jgi:hypothetical protein
VRVDIHIVAGEANGKNADDGVEIVVEADLLAEDVAATREVALSKCVTQDGDRIGFRLISCVVSREGAAEQGRNTEEFEGIRREEFLVDGFGQAGLGHDHAASLVQDQALGTFGARLQLEIPM